MASLRTKVEVYHLYGHQDEVENYAHLPRDAQLNVQVNDSAQHALQWAYEHSQFVSNPSFSGEGWQLLVNGSKVYCHIRPAIRSHLGCHNLRQYLYDSSHLSWNFFSQVDFDPLEHYLCGQSQAFCLWFTKHWTNFCGIGKMMKRMKLWNTDLCPCCDQIPETSTLHLFMCPSPVIHQARQTLFTDILGWLAEVDTAPDLLHLISCLWYRRQPSFDKEDTLLLRKLWTILVEIGTSGMWQGLLPRGMVEYQQEYYHSIGSKRSGRKWASRLVGRVLRATHHLWMLRNDMVHLKTEEGLKGMDLVVLQHEVESEVNRGVDMMEPEDHYLLDIHLPTLLLEPVEYLRGWLCSVKLARGDFEAAREE